MVACGEMEEPLDPPNILWITHEDLSPIYGCYGDEYATTPNIDKFAETGIMFSKAFSNAPICAPARSTLITGMYATSLGTQHLRSDIPLPADFKILPEYIRRSWLLYY
jgi:N-sulfoglucosamine sulfohydrolase